MATAAAAIWLDLVLQPKLGPLREHIERMLEVDRQAPRKQRHTTHRIWTRLRAGQPELPVAEPTVLRYTWDCGSTNRG